MAPLTPVTGIQAPQEDTISQEIQSVLKGLGISIKISNFKVTEDGVDPSATDPSDVIATDDPFQVSADITFDAPSTPPFIRTLLNLILLSSELRVKFYAESYGPGPEFVLGETVLATASGVSPSGPITYNVLLTVNPNPLQTGDVYKLAAAVRLALLPGLPPVVRNQPVAHGFLEGLAVEAYDPTAIANI